MDRRIITLVEAQDLFYHSSPELVRCQLDRSPADLHFFDLGNGEWASSDMWEGEGGNELICDVEGNILRFDGYYITCDEHGVWSE